MKANFVTKDVVLDTVSKATSMLDVGEILLLNRNLKMKRTTVERALRKLKEEKKVVFSLRPDGRKAWGPTQLNLPLPTVTIPLTSFTAPLPVIGIPTMTPNIHVSTLDSAVQNLLLNKVIPAKKVFSAHDITIELRDMVFAGTLNTIDPNEVGTIWHQGKKVPKIEHEDVRAAIQNIFDAGQMQGYGRVFTGVWWQYEPISAN